MDRARSLVGGRFDSGVTDTFYSDTLDLLPYLNLAIIDVSAKTKCLEKLETITLLTGVTAYTISSNFIDVQRAVYSGATTAYDTNPWKGLNRTTINKIGHLENVGEPVQFYIWRNQIIIDPQPASGVSGYKVYLYLTERPTLLTSGSSAIPTPAIYDKALVHFVTSLGFARNQNAAMAKFHMDMYLAEITQGRLDYADEEKKPK